MCSNLEGTLVEVRVLVCVCACVWYDNYGEREIKKGIPKPFLCVRKGGGGERFKGCNYTESRGKIREKG